MLSVIEEEVNLLRGRTDRLVIGGMSQGMAMALWTHLCGVGRVGTTDTRCWGPFAAFFGICGWLPFSNEVSKAIEVIDDDNTEDARQPGAHGKENVAANVMSVVDAVRGRVGNHNDSTAKSSKSGNPKTLNAIAKTEGPKSLRSTPIFLCHGRDDLVVDVSLGQEASQLLTRTGAEVEWKVHTVGTAKESGAHWIAEPEGFDDLVCFLEKCTTARR